MVTCWFIVMESGGVWWVDCEGKAYGPFERQQEAEENAQRIARTYGDPARQSVVYAPDDDGKLRAVWYA